MIQVSAPNMAVFGNWRDHYYPQRPPLSAIVLAQWTRLFGDGEASLRLSLIGIGCATILMFHAVARRLTEHPWDLVATILFAFNPMFLYFSIIAVHYAYGLFFSLSAWAAALRIGESRWYSILMFVSLGLGCFTDWPPYFTALSLMVYFWKSRGSFQSWSIGAFATACFGLNLLHRWWLDPETGRFVRKLIGVGVQHASLRGIPFWGYLFGECREVGLYFTVGLTLASVWGIGVLVGRKYWTPLLFGLFGLEELLFIRQAYEHDYLTYSLAPFMSLTAAAGLRDLWGRRSLRPYALGLATLAFAQAVWVTADRMTRVGGNEPAWRAAVLIRQHTTPDQRTLLAMDNSLIEYYGDRYASRIDTILHALSLSPTGPVAIHRIEDLTAYLERGNSGFDLIVVGAAEQALANIEFFRKVGISGGRLKEFGFYPDDHPLRRLLHRIARKEQTDGAFVLYWLR